jgi:hypothetical protein
MRQEPNTTQPPIPQEKRNLQKVIVELAIILLVSLPLMYSLGQSNGYNAGYQAGTIQAYAEGFDNGFESGKFNFYYVKPEQKYGVYDLSDWLSRWKWIRTYQEGVFDCSEMSAYLEWKLENEGWHTYIIFGDSPFSSGKHAWFLVETTSGKYMPVESTTMSVAWWDSPYFDNYFTYEHQFETIQDALSYSETEFDWWKS